MREVQEKIQIIDRFPVIREVPSLEHEKSKEQHSQYNPESSHQSFPLIALLETGLSSWLLYCSDSTSAG